jgi:hypothetical protein
MFDFMYNQSTDDYIDKLTNWSKDKIDDFLGPYLLQLESFNPFVNKFISSPIEAIREWLE